MVTPETKTGPVRTGLVGPKSTITGTPTKAGTYTFRVQVAQGVPSAQMAYEMTVDPALPFGIATDRLPDGVFGLGFFIYFVGGAIDRVVRVALPHLEDGDVVPPDPRDLRLDDDVVAGFEDRVGHGK